MASPQTLAAHVGSPAAIEPQTPQPIPSLQPHLLRREGVMHFLSAAEQAMEDAMLRSSLTPEPVLRKRNRQGDDLLQDGVDTEPDEDPSLPTQPQPLSPSIKNVTAAALRYSVKKKLQPEQRDEVDAFLLVSDRLH